MIALILAQIKQYSQLILIAVVVALIAGAVFYIHHHGVIAGEAIIQKELNAYIQNSENEIAVAAQLKRTQEREDAKNSEIVIDAYNTQLIDLTQRVRIVKTVQGGCSVQVASEIRPASAVPSTPSPASGINETTQAVTTVVINPVDALEDTLQCKELQEWVRAEIK